MRPIRVPDHVAVLVALACAALAAAPAVAFTPPPIGIHAPFYGCPVDDPAFMTAASDPSNTGVCIYGVTTSGQVTIGNATVPIVNPIVLQGGDIVDSDGNETWWNASPPSQTLVDPGQPVPGGLSGDPSDTSPGNSVTAVTELVGPVQINRSNLLSEAGPGFVLPVKFHLINPVLGPDCHIGSDGDPIVLNLTTGTTNPPPPNMPISGTIADLVFDDNFQLVTINTLGLVDNTFGVPGATGCGTADALDGVVNSVVGLPSPAGLNTAILDGSAGNAIAQRVLDDVPPTTSVNCSPDSFAPGDATTCTATLTLLPTQTTTPTGTVSFSSSGAGNFVGDATCTLTEISPGVASCLATFTSLVPGSQMITGSYSGDDGHPASSGDSTVTVAEPASTVGCHVIGRGGILAANGDKASYAVNAQVPPPQRQQRYRDRGPINAIAVRSLQLDALTCSLDATQASIFGSAEIKGAGSVPYRVDVTPGGIGTGSYRIRLGNGYDSGVQPLRIGKIQIKPV